MPKDLPTPKTRGELIDMLKAIPGDTMHFRLQREPKPGETFSTGGLDDIHANIGAWMGTRLIRRMDRTPKIAPGPSDMVVTITVTFDGEAPVIMPADETPDYILQDGGLKAAGVAKETR